MDKEKLMEILQDLHPEVDFSEEEDLFKRRILTSFDIVSLITELSDAFDVEITAEDMIPENFYSAETIIQLVARKLEEEE